MKDRTEAKRAASLHGQAAKDAAEALRPILASGHPGRFKLLTVVCDNGHRLVVVYRTAIGPVYLAESGLTWRSTTPAADPAAGPYPSPTADEYEARAITQQGRVEYVDDLERQGKEDPQTARGGRFSASCRCRSMTIHLTWLRAQLTTGRRRVVLGQAAS